MKTLYRLFLLLGFALLFNPIHSQAQDIDVDCEEWVFEEVPCPGDFENVRDWITTLDSLQVDFDWEDWLEDFFNPFDDDDDDDEEEDDDEEDGEDDDDDWDDDEFEWLDCSEWPFDFACPNDSLYNDFDEWLDSLATDLGEDFEMWEDSLEAYLDELEDHWEDEHGDDDDDDDHEGDDDDDEHDWDDDEFDWLDCTDWPFDFECPTDSTYNDFDEWLDSLATDLGEDFEMWEDSLYAYFDELEDRWEEEHGDDDDDEDDDEEEDEEDDDDEGDDREDDWDDDEFAWIDCTEWPFDFECPNDSLYNDFDEWIEVLANDLGEDFEMWMDSLDVYFDELEDRWEEEHDDDDHDWDDDEFDWADCEEWPFDVVCPTDSTFANVDEWLGHVSDQLGENFEGWLERFRAYLGDWEDDDDDDDDEEEDDDDEEEDDEEEDDEEDDEEEDDDDGEGFGWEEASVFWETIFNYIDENYEGNTAIDFTRDEDSWIVTLNNEVTIIFDREASAITLVGIEGDNPSVLPTDIQTFLEENFEDCTYDIVSIEYEGQAAIQITVDCTGKTAGGEILIFDLYGNLLSQEAVTTGLENTSFASEIELYPNPSINVAQVALTSTQTGTMAIYTMAGQQVLQGSFDQVSHFNIDVSELANGVYLLHINTAEGEAIKQLTIAK